MPRPIASFPPFRRGALGAASLALVLLIPAATSAASTGAAAAAPHARSAPFTIGLSARSVKGGSKVTVSGLANARAGTSLMIMSDALSSTRLVGGVPTITTPAFVEGTYRTTILVPPATQPGRYSVTVRANGKQVAMTSITVVKRGRPGPRPTNRTACAGIGFTVLHDDRSSGVTLPAGPYTVTSRNLDCSVASADFTRFLDRYNGPIPGWSATTSGAGRGTFTQRGTGKAFTVTHGR